MSSASALGLELELRHDAPALDFAATLPLGAISALVGPSGSGKTSILRATAGLLRAQHARVSFAGEVWSSATHHQPTRERRIGFVAQQQALFPHLSALGNVEAALLHLGAPERRAHAQRCLALAQASGLGEHKPHQLSGGQRQRVALARALARVLTRSEPMRSAAAAAARELTPTRAAPEGPIGAAHGADHGTHRAAAEGAPVDAVQDAPGGRALLLLDEPFSAVDRNTRRPLYVELRRLHAQLGATIVLVTHDLDEAAQLASHVVLLNRGRRVQAGPTSEVLTRPASVEAAQLLDIGNLLDAVVEADTLRWGPHRLRCDAALPPSGTTVRCAVLPANLLLVRPDKPEASALGNVFAAQVAEVIELGAEAVVALQPEGVAGAGLQMRLPTRAVRQHGLAAGQVVKIMLRPRDLVLLSH